jgi:hypothetical protein
VYGAGVHVTGTRARAFGGLAIVSALGSAWLAPGCKTKESLVVVAMQARDTNATGLSTVTITVTDGATLVVSRDFDLPATGLPMTPDSLEYGVYVGVTGNVTVTVAGRKPSGDCAGYIGTHVVKVVAGDSPRVPIVMSPGNVCTVTGTGGTMGGGGSGFGGTGGSGGSTSACGTTVGSRPPTVAPPSLANCIDLDQNDAGLVCDPVADTNNPIMYSVAASPDGQLLVTAGWHSLNDDVSLKIWRTQGGTPVPCGPELTGTGLGAPYVAFSPDGKHLAVATRLTWAVDVFSIPSLNLESELKSAVGPLYGAGFSPDSQTVFTLDYDFANDDGHIYANRLDGTAITSRMLGVDPDSLAISPVASNGKVNLAVAGYFGNVGVYTFNGTTFSAPSVLTTSGVAGALGIAFSPDGQLLAAGTDDGVVRFWSAPFTTNATSGAPINFGSTAYTPAGIAFAPGGTYMAITVGPEVDIWNATTRAFVSRHNTTAIPGGAATPYAFSVTFSASGGALITGQDLCGKIAYCSD